MIFLAVLAAALVGMAAPPFTAGWVSVGTAAAGVGLWVACLDRVRSRSGAVWVGGLFMGGASGMVLHWAPAAAEPYLGMGGGILAGISVWLLHAGVGAAVAAAVFQLKGILPLAMRAGAGWGVMEWLPGALPVVGMPWFGVGWALLDSPLLPGVSVFGAAGFGIMVAVAAGFGVDLASWPKRMLGWLILLMLWVGIPWGLSLRPMAQPTPLPVLGTLTLHRDRALLSNPAEMRADLEDVLTAILPALPEGIPMLWPEAPLGQILTEDPLVLGYLQTVQRSGEGTGGAGAVAGVHAQVGSRRYNTLVRTGDASDPPIGVHRKRYLVPGVERTHVTRAGRLLPDPQGGASQVRGLAPGAGALPFRWGEVMAGGLLCFEILYPVEVARLRRRGGQLLVQATQDTMLQPGGPLPVWRDAARGQHEAMVRLRAAEFQLPVLRAALGGEGLAVGIDGHRKVPSTTSPILGPNAAVLGRVETFQMDAPPPPPPSGWTVPLTGPLSMALLLIPLLADWRRRRLGLAR